MFAPAHHDLQLVRRYYLPAVHHPHGGLVLRRPGQHDPYRSCCTAPCGIGGSAFWHLPSTGLLPKRLAGAALGLQGGIGSLGMSVIQLVGPISWAAGRHDLAGTPRGEPAKPRPERSGSPQRRSLLHSVVHPRGDLAFI